MNCHDSLWAQIECVDDDRASQGRLNISLRRNNHCLLAVLTAYVINEFPLKQTKPEAHYCSPLRIAKAVLKHRLAARAWRQRFESRWGYLDTWNANWLYHLNACLGSTSQRPLALVEQCSTKLIWTLEAQCDRYLASLIETVASTTFPLCWPYLSSPGRGRVTAK